VLSPEENLVSPDQAVRQKGLEKIKWIIDRSQDLGSQVLCGPFHSAFATFSKAAPQEIEYERSAEILHQAGDYAAEAGISY
jgi:D-psicose/D-tagatose/L-ribulose 3-epimerase